MGRSEIDWWRNSLLIFFIIFILSPAAGQETTVYTSNVKEYNLALELYDKEKFSAAQYYFDKVVEQNESDRSEIAISSRYYSAICAMELFNENAERLLVQFIRDYPENPKTKVANYQLGKYWFRKRRYKNAIAWFEKVSVYDLGNDDIAEYYFKIGYSYFMEEMNEKSKKAFYEIKDTDTRFTATARYYYAHLSYLDRNYETALKDFKKIEKHPKFSGIVPYYLAQIYFLQKKYDTLLVYGPPLLDSASTKRRPEIAKLIGEAHYNKGQYKESIPYLSQFVTDGIPNNNDYYQLGFANYKADDCKAAIGWFEKAIVGDDSLSQISYYHLADCYLKLDDKVNARNFLGRAAALEFDDEVRENSMFNYAKLAYELSYHPYNDAIRAFEKYINTYPESVRIPNAHEYLIGVYFTTKNYKEALKSLDRIENRSVKLEQAYQKVAYLRALELYNERNFELAIQHFDLSLQKDYDVTTRLSALFWKAESYYQIYQQENAIESYQKFLQSPTAITNEYYSRAYYGTGYANYRIKSYSAAITAFRNFIRIEKEDQNRVNDALIRVGDCYFINTQYDEAIEYYDKAILIGLIDTDYALFQSGVANGVINNKVEKTTLLTTLIKSYENSPYRDDALYELGDAYIDTDNKKALNYFNELKEEYPNSSYISKAHLKTGLINYNSGNDELALNSFKTVIVQFKNTPEAAQALDKVRMIYTEKGDLKGFQDFISSAPDLNITQSSLDSARYEIAENNYMNGNCEDAVKNFTAYLNSDTTGQFELNARFYRAECEVKSGFYDEAAMDYEYILEIPGNKFYEASLLQLARVYNNQEKSEKAIKYYSDLRNSAEIKENIEEANLMLTKLHYKAENYEKAIEFGELTLKQLKLSERNKEEVQMIMAKSYQKLDDYNKAYQLFVKLSANNSNYGAEAKYNAAAIEFLRGNLVKSEEFIMKTINQVPSNDYWIAKAFILLSDKYLAEEDIFQAKYTLESVLENYEGAELTDIAKGKLKLIEGMEKKEEEEKLRNQEEIIIQETEEDYDYLFEEEEIKEEVNYE